MRIAGLWMATFLLALGITAWGTEGQPVKSWAEWVDRAAKDERLAGARAEFLTRAREVAALPIVRRVYRLEDVGQHRTWLDGRSNALGPETKEKFALAMSDFAACNTLASEMPLLAAAYRMTGEEAFRARVLAQLAEAASWSPLQRPGWTCYAPENRLPADGKDGNWLATGTGVRGIADALEIMPPGTIPPPLRARLEALLEGEIAGVVDDWQVKRPWFVSSDNPITNQWMLPTEGLVRACLVLGVDKHRAAYETGVRNFLRALQAHGRAGEFEEGVGYADFTVTSMLHTAHAMAVAGDRRALEQPFLRHFPTWLVSHLQPGDMLINCFDAGPATGHERLRPLLSLLAVCTGSDVARWALASLADGPAVDIPGLLARGSANLGASAAPPLFAAYERAARVNWRDSWDPAATGVWVRGGHRLDQHDHCDRGHVNLILHGRPVLIEAGTPSYDNPRMYSHYHAGVGHNVLQVGEDLPETRPAPITVRRLNAKGGKVVVNPTACYKGVERWLREVEWSADWLAVTDTVALAKGREDTILFRWHLGTTQPVSVTGAGGKFEVTWEGVRLTLEASSPITVSQEMLPDNTLPPVPGGTAEPHHTCLVVRSEGKTGRIRLITGVAAVGPGS